MKKTIFEGFVNGVSYNDANSYAAALQEAMSEGTLVSCQSSLKIVDDPATTPNTPETPGNVPGYQAIILDGNYVELLDDEKQIEALENALEGFKPNCRARAQINEILARLQADVDMSDQAIEKMEKQLEELEKEADAVRNRIDIVSNTADKMDVVREIFEDVLGNNPETTCRCTCEQKTIAEEETKPNILRFIEAIVNGD